VDVLPQIREEPPEQEGEDCLLIGDPVPACVVRADFRAVAAVDVDAVLVHRSVHRLPAVAAVDYARQGVRPVVAGRPAFLEFPSDLALHAVPQVAGDDALVAVPGDDGFGLAFDLTGRHLFAAVRAEEVTLWRFADPQAARIDGVLEHPGNVLPLPANPCGRG